MRNLSSHARLLNWTQPSFFRRAYELRSGTDLLATMHLRGLIGSFATVESREGAWTFKRLGWCGTIATARVRGETTDLAEFRKDLWTMSGVLTFARGSKFRAAMNFWMTRFEIGTESLGPVLRFVRRGFACRSAEVEILDKDAPEIPMLVLFGWYLLLMLHQDASAVVIT